MKATTLPSLLLFSACSLLMITPHWHEAAAEDAREIKPETSAEKGRPSKGEKGQKRRENAALKELRKELDMTRNELEKTRDNLHEAHKELGSKAEFISTLEAKLSSVTAQLEKVQEVVKKSNTTTRTMEKQEKDLESGRKHLAELQNEIKTLEKKASAASALAKKANPEAKTSRSPDAEPESTRKEAAASKTGIIAPIIYESASAVNYPERDRALKEVAEALRKSPKATVEITGHADDSKYAQTNADVSTNRAKFLAAYFVLHGIPEERIVVRGLGNTKPLKDQANRRVELRILP